MRERAALTGILLRHELLMLMRDKRTVVLSILLPLAVMPLMLFANLWVLERREKKLEATTYTYSVVGSQAAEARALIAEALAARQRDTDRELPLLREEEAEDPEASLRREELHFFVETFSPEEAARLDREAAEAESEQDGKPDSPEPEQGAMGGRVPLYRIAFQADRDASQAGAAKLRDLLTETRQRRQAALLSERGFPLERDQVVPVETRDVASGGQVSGARLGKLVTLMLLFFLFTGGSVVATDSIAGEKERGTLETLLTSSVDRLNIVSAKLLAVFVVALVITLIQVLNLLVYVGLGVIPLPEDFVLEVSPLAALVILLLYLPLAALVSAVLLALSGRAKSYKEAQLYFMPVFLLGLLPALAALMPGLELRSAVVLVPVANTSVAVREVLTGRFDWPFLLLGWLVTMAAAWWAIKGTVRSLAVERLITSVDREREEFVGGASLFPRHVLYWFGLLWVLLFVVAVNVEALASLKGQIAFNLGVLFLGGSLLMIWRYRLPVREALALRRPRPAVWLAVAVGAPAANLTAIGLFRLVSLVLPVPERLVEEFARQLLPEALPTWQLALLLAVLPGLIEELTFRGVLLHGLHRRFRPLTLCLVVGLIFGVFHVSIYRVVPTMYLGVILTAVVLLTGSIFPAMIWHALNNLLGVWAMEAGAGLEELPAWLHLLAAALLALSFWVLYRDRTPYPGLRPWRRPREGHEP